MPSHGSLTKAGKVRSQTPKIPPKPKKNKPPRIRNRKEYIERFVLAPQRQQTRRWRRR